MPIGYHFDVPNNFTGIHVDNQNNKHWFRNGKRHRLDGPCIEWHDGYKTYYLYGLSLYEEDYYKEISNLPLYHWKLFKMGYKP